MDIYAGNSTSIGRVNVGGSITGEIETFGDKDWIGVDLVAGSRYTFTMTTEALSDLGTIKGYAMEGLIGPNGRNLSFRNESSPIHPVSAVIKYIALESGSYFVPLRGAPDYPFLSPQEQVGGYRLSVEEITNRDDHGDSPNTATALAFCQPVTGFLNQGLPSGTNEIDVFSVDLEQGEIFDVDLEWRSVDPYAYATLRPPKVYSYDMDTFSRVEGNVTSQSGSYFFELTGFRLISYDLEVTSPWTYSAAQLAKYTDTGFPESFSTSNISHYNSGKHRMVSPTAQDDVVHSGGTQATIIGGGGNDLVLGTAGFDLLIGDLDIPVQRMQAEFQVNVLYEVILGHDIDATGDAQLQQELDLGLADTDVEGFTRAWASKILRSTEFSVHNGPVDNQDSGSNETYIRTLYDGLRGGPPTVQDLNTWLYFMRFSPGEDYVAQWFAETPEAITRFGTDKLVDMLIPDVDADFGLLYSAYETLLGRAPDATGLSGWGKSLAQGGIIETVVTGILQSPEYFLKTNRRLSTTRSRLRQCLKMQWRGLQPPMQIPSTVGCATIPPMMC